jgi:hypothetical protein
MVPRAKFKYSMYRRKKLRPDAPRAARTPEGVGEKGGETRLEKGDLDRFPACR